MRGLRPLEGEPSAVGGCKLEVRGGKIEDEKMEGGNTGGQMLEVRGRMVG